MLQQRELRGMSVRVRAVAALLRVFLSVCFWRSSVLCFRLAFVNQESLLFGCCGPWARGNITTANWQYAGHTAANAVAGAAATDASAAAGALNPTDVVLFPTSPCTAECRLKEASHTPGALPLGGCPGNPLCGLWLSLSARSAALY